ncbi:hypothetical protein Q1695_003156 [Nippostrongylus brasiliensis]|nr:hypothetical protein Q1695_003156 [Nippostrongylus brasiliensis]
MAANDPFAVATTAASNASIDRVVFQIEMLSGQINVLTYQIDGAVAAIKERGEETVASISSNFNNDTIENVKRMLHIVSEKTHDWPVTALIVVAITALVLIAITFMFLMAKGGERLVERRFGKRVPLEDHAIENL